MRARSRALRAVGAPAAVVFVALGLAFAVSAEAAAYAVPLLTVLAATLGGRYAGADRLLAVADQIWGRSDRRATAGLRLPSRWHEGSRVLHGRAVHPVGTPRAPPAFLAA